jgi:hypothetical protein
MEAANTVGVNDFKIKQFFIWKSSQKIEKSSEWTWQERLAGTKQQSMKFVQIQKIYEKT